MQVLTFSVVNKDGVYNTGSKMKELQCTTVLKGRSVYLAERDRLSVMK